MQRMNQNRNGEASSVGNNNKDNAIEVSNGGHIRFARLDFPIFSAYYNSPYQQRLPLASFHTEGKTLIWFQDLEEFDMLTDWDMFAKALLLRFGASSYNDPKEALTRLR